MKRKISEIIKYSVTLRYALVVVGAIFVCVLICATIFGADLNTFEVNHNGEITEITCHNNTVGNALSKAGIKLDEGDTLSCDKSVLLSDIDYIQISSINETVLSVPGHVYTFPSTHGNAVDYALELSDRNGLDILTPEERLEAEATPEPTPAPLTETTEYVTEYWDIDYSTEYTADDNMYEGESKTVRDGVKGQRQVEYVVKKLGDQILSKDVQKSTVIKEAVNKQVVYGTKKRATTAKGKPLAYKSVLSNYNSTAYSAQEPGNVWGYATAYGIRAQAGVIAVDPKVIPLGTKVYVEGVGGNPDYGYAIAADTGSAIKENIIDVYIESVKECYQWGRKKVNIYILEDQSVNVFNMR